MRNFILLLFFAVISLSINGQAVDDCASATAQNLSNYPHNVSVDMSAFGDEGDYTATSIANPIVTGFYAFSVAQEGYYEISFGAGTASGNLSVGGPVEGGCPSQEALAGNINQGFDLGACFYFETGKTYYIAMALEDGNKGEFTMTIDFPAPNDNCEDAIQISQGNYQGSTKCAGGTFYTYCNFNENNSHQVVYKYTNNKNVPVDLTLSFDPPSDDDDAINIGVVATTSPCGGTSYIPYPGSEECKAIDRDPKISCIPVGETVYVVVGSQDNREGDFSMNVTETELNNVPSNNVCEDAELLAYGGADNCTEKTYTGKSNTDACPGSKLIGTCDLTQGPTTWYKVNIPQDADKLNVSIVGASFNSPVLVLMTKCDGSGDNYCSQGGGGNAQASINDLQNTNVVYIGVSDPNGNGGNFDITIEILTPPNYDKPCINDANGPYNLSLNETKRANTCCASKEVENVACGPGSDRSVWFTYNPTQNTQGINIDVTGVSVQGNVTVEARWAENDYGCNNNFNYYEIAGSHCSGLPAQIKFSTCGYNNKTLYIKVASTSDNCGTFDIKISEEQGCDKFADICDNITSDLTLEPITEGSAACVNSCNNFACTEALSCMGGSHSTWFRVNTDAQATTLQINLSENDFQPYITVYDGADCNNLTTVLAQCTTEPSFNVPVSVNSSYLIMVESQDEDAVDDDFKLCVTSFFKTFECYTVQSTVTRPDNPNQDPNGPYCPEERVRFCYEIDFIVSGGNQSPPDGNNCQWIQGIIPCFGPGWDLAGSDPIEGQGPQVGQGNWFWLDEGNVYYNFDNNAYELYPHPITGKKVLVRHSTSDPNNNPVSQGDFLPGGWWATSPGGNGCQNDLGDPNTTWGMKLPQTCGGHQIVNFCIELKVKSINQILDCNNDDYNDLSLDLFAFADGETGCYTNLSCALSLPDEFYGKIECNVPDSVKADNTDVCSGVPFNIPISLHNGGNNAIEIEYSPNNPSNVSGGSSLTLQGGGGNLSQTLTVTGNNCTPVDVIYLMSSIDQSLICSGGKDTLVVTVYPEVQLKKENLPTDGICYDDLPKDINLEAECGKPGDDGYKFRWEDNFGNKGTDGKIVMDKNFGGGIHSFDVTITDELGCEKVEMFDIEIYPEIRFELEDNAVCWGDPTSFEPINVGTGNYSYNWYWENNAISTSDNGKNKKYNITEQDFASGKIKAGDWKLCLEVSEKHGNITCSRDACVSVKISPMFAARIEPSPIVLCHEDDKIELTVFRGNDPNYFNDWNRFEFIWPNNTLDASIHTHADGPGKGFAVKITDRLSNCDTTLYYDVDVAEAPNLSIEGELQVCEGESTTLTVGGDVSEFKSYKWSNGETTKSITVNPNTNTEYTVTVTAAGNCEYDKSVEVLVIPATNIPNMADVTYCIGHSQTATAPDGYDSYQWYINDINSNPISTDKSVTIDSEENYILVVTKNGCSAKDTITGIPSSNLNPNLFGDTILCSYISSTIMFTTGEYNTIEWYSGTDANGQLLNSDISKDSIRLSAGTYYLYVADNNGCDGGRVFNIINLPAVEPDIYPTKDTIVVCYGKDTVLYSNPTDNYEEYKWYKGSTDGSSLSSNDTIYVSEEGKYYLRVKNSSNCYGLDSIYVDIANELIPKLPNSVKICEGDSIDLDAGAGFDGYSWYVNDVLQNQYNDKQSIKTGNGGTYTVAVFDKWGCSVYDTTVVDIIAKLEPKILGARDLCDDETIELSCNKKFDSYKWSIANDNTTISTDSLFNFKMPDGKDSITLILSVTFSEDNATCEGEDMVVIKRYHSPVLELKDDTIKTCGKGSSGSAIINLDFRQYFKSYDNKGGSWKDLDNSGAYPNADWTDVAFTNVPVNKTYKFEFETNSAHEPCINIKDTLYVYVELCECDGWDINTIQDICTDENTSTINLNDSITVQPPPAGKWSVTNGDPTALSGSTFDPLKGQAGSYELTYTLDDKGNYCNISRAITFEVQNKPKLG